MKFFKFLAIVFPIYALLVLFSVFILNFNHNLQLPEILGKILELLGISTIIITLPFTPLLKSLGFYTTAYWSFPTFNGIAISFLIWELIFVVLYFVFRNKSRKLTS